MRTAERQKRPFHVLPADLSPQNSLGKSRTFRGSRRHRALSDEEEFQSTLNKIPPRPLAQNRTPDGRLYYSNTKRLHHVCTLRASAVRMFAISRMTICAKPVASEWTTFYEIRLFCAAYFFRFPSIICIISAGVTTNGFIGKSLMLPVTRYASCSCRASIVTSYKMMSLGSDGVSSV